MAWRETRLLADGSVTGAPPLALTPMDPVAPVLVEVARPALGVFAIVDVG
jgi:hypothetical protein